MSMNITNFLSFAKTTPATDSLYVKGDHGIGKTSIMKTLAEYFGLELVTFNCSELADVGDVIGIPTIEEYTDSNGVKQKRTTWAAPFWYNPDKPVLLFFDELPRARPEITNALMQLTLERKILDKKLPEGSRVVAAGNPQGSGHYSAEILDAAKLSRFWSCNLVPTFEETITHLTKVGVHKALLAYLAKNRNDLFPWTNTLLSDASKTAEVVLPCPRSYERASDWLHNAEKILGGKLNRSFVVDGIAGYLGEAVANKFWPFYDESSSQFGAEDILSAYDDVVGDEKVAALDTPSATILMNNILLWCQGKGDNEATDSEKSNFKKFFNALQPEVCAALTRDVIQKSLLSGEANNITMLTDEEMEATILELASMGV